MSADDPFPILPYDGTSGWSGSSTSRERAIHNDETGITSKRQRRVLSAVTEAGAHGVTAAELCDLFRLPTNSVAPSLTHLHKDGRIERVKERRNKHEVYVLPEHVNGRETTPPGRHGNATEEQLRVAREEAWGEAHDEFCDEQDYVSQCDHVNPYAR